MPELPEVETLRRMVEPRVLGAKVLSVDIRRLDVIRRASGRVMPRNVLAGDVVARTLRRGKQLALIGKSGRVIVVQLGMSGHLSCEGDDEKVFHTHVHCVWKTQRADGVRERMLFRDPRRFGGITCLDRVKDLELRWNELGSDALDLQANELGMKLLGSSRPVKAALLDQNVVAGIGNIYADEILFACGIRPTRRAERVSEDELEQIAVATRRILHNAIAARGSSVRDYRDGDGNLGENQKSLKVYGRGGQDCLRCGKKLITQTLAQRTTVWCRGCQS